MKLLSTLIFAVLLAGCATAPSAPKIAVERALFNDSAFRQPDNMMAPEQIFALTPEMKDYTARIMARHRTSNDLHQALIAALYERDQLRLEYDSEMTRSAAQAFEARSGNCLSLVIMTAAFAHELGLKVKFQRVTSQDTWSRSGTLYFSSGHVNLVLTKPVGTTISLMDNKHSVTIDFLPPPDAEMMPTEEISERAIVALFMNNRAAENLVQGKLDEAYWWTRAAIEYDNTFLLGYNTLSTIYQRRGDLERAEQALRFAHRHDPHNTVVLFNLAEVAASRGKHEEAARLKADLARLEPYPPFHFFNLGQQAMNEGDYKKARAMFVREVQRAPYYHEFHFGLAKAAFALGNLKEADKHMSLALNNSTTRNETAIYASKLANLRLYETRARLRQEF